MNRNIEITNTMKKTLLALLTMIFATTLGFSQDVLTTVQGEDIQSKILEITTTEVKYKKYDNQDGPTFSSLKWNKGYLY